MHSIWDIFMMSSKDMKNSRNRSNWSKYKNGTHTILILICRSDDIKFDAICNTILSGFLLCSIKKGYSKYRIRIITLSSNNTDMWSKCHCPLGDKRIGCKLITSIKKTWEHFIKKTYTLTLQCISSNFCGKSDCTVILFVLAVETGRMKKFADRNCYLHPNCSQCIQLHLL